MRISTVIRREILTAAYGGRSEWRELDESRERGVRGERREIRMRREAMNVRRGARRESALREARGEIERRESRHEGVMRDERQVARGDRRAARSESERREVRVRGERREERPRREGENERRERDASALQASGERRARRTYRLSVASRNLIRDMPENQFKKAYRLSKTQVLQLGFDLMPFLGEPERTQGLSAMHKILIALSFYATGSYQKLIGQSSVHKVSQPTVSRAVKEVTLALNKVYKKYIPWPRSTDERNNIKAKFYNKFGIPGILGCIDGTHVAIIRPVVHEERYYNRKGYHSLNVMIICDSDLNILCVDPSSPGSAHDSTVWQSHPLNPHLTEVYNSGEHVFLLGDSGYPLRPTIMTPILDTTPGTPEHNYYMRHVTARNSVERCIGLLKARFRCLLVARTLHYSPEKAAAIVNACCVLHNIANRNRLQNSTPLTPEQAAEERRVQQQVDEQLLRQANNPERRVHPELYRGRLLQRALVETLN